MRFRLETLPPALEAALAKRLAENGHQAAATEADALVVGVAAAPPTAVLELSQEDWEQGIAATRSTFVAVRDFAADLVAREEPGRIVVVIDTSAVRVAEGLVRPAVSGAFLSTIAEVAAVELGPRAIAVNVLAVGPVAPAPAGLVAGVPLGRLATPEEIAGACEFLLSERASFVTGATLVADGGYVVTKAAGGNPLLRDDNTQEID